METGSIFLKIPSDKFYLGLVRKVIVDFAEKVGFDPIETSKIEMAVDEACANVIDHAYKNDEHVSFYNQRDDIHIRIDVDEKKIIINILDKGKHFDLNDQLQKIPELDAHLNNMNINGLGLYVIKNFMDDVKFNRTDDGFNKLSMTKLLKPA